ncbi:MAG: F0F1 ATP synthase subunit A [Anaerolineales bacterium]|nr:F0F1 ATP synthase subunit A [Anaerolineales bacterium]NTW12059.1 F0F1 ATP synthase subunit A [Anaerolineales bacterium]
MEQVKRRPWRRWVVLVIMIVGWYLGGIYAPIQPEIVVAPEKLSYEPLFTLPVIGDFYLVNTLPTLAVTLVLLIMVAYFTRQSLTRSAQTDLVPRGIGNVMEAILEILYNMTEGAAGKWVKVIFPWFATIMIYVLFANLLKLLPGFETIGLIKEAHGEGGHAYVQLFGNWNMLTPEEGHYVLYPFFRGISVDLNFTFALALLAVVFIQVVGFRAHGWGYLTKFFNFGGVFKKPVFGVIDMFMGILELISEFAKILSFAFRLFGNMFAGIVLVAVVGSLLGKVTIVPAMIFMFELFVGVIQAFVFGILTMVFMVMATQGHGGEEHAEH